MDVVFIVSRFPYPLEKGDKLRAFQHIINMYNSGVQIHLIAISDIKVEGSSIEKLNPYCKSIQILRLNKFQIFINLVSSFFRNIPIQVGYFYSNKFRNQIQTLIKDVNPDIVYCQLIRTALFVKNLNIKPKVIDYQDAFSHGTYQRSKNAPLLLKWLFQREISLVKKFEYKSFDWFNSHFIISNQDRNWLNVASKSKVIVLPNGIDTDYFSTSDSVKKFDVTFIGNMQYAPNVDGAEFLINEIMPIVWKTYPDAVVQLGGAEPDARVRALKSDKVHVTGWVDDIRDCYKNSRVFVAPMRIGTGLQNKLLEAMAMQLACVTTPLSYEPLGAQSEINILIGETPLQLAEQIIRLLSDNTLRNKLSFGGRKFVEEKYSLSYSKEILMNDFDSLLKNN